MKELLEILEGAFVACIVIAGIVSITGCLAAVLGGGGYG